MFGQMQYCHRVARIVAAIVSLGGVSEVAAQAALVESVIETQAEIEAAARSSQIRIAQLDEEATRLLGDYRRAVAEADNLTTYNSQLEAQVQSQQEEIAGIVGQLAEIETTATQVVPMMMRMVDTLDRFVQMDLPFLPEERRARIANLRDIMRRADVTVAEKYRRIVEAYGVEMEYGRTIESYRAALVAEGEQRTVDFLRVGRVTLLFQTLDGGETGYWNGGTSAWIVDNDLGSPVRQGLRIAKQQAAPNLIIVPVTAPEETSL